MLAKTADRFIKSQQPIIVRNARYDETFIITIARRDRYNLFTVSGGVFDRGDLEFIAIAESAESNIVTIDDCLIEVVDYYDGAISFDEIARIALAEECAYVRVRKSIDGFAVALYHRDPQRGFRRVITIPQPQSLEEKITEWAQQTMVELDGLFAQLSPAPAPGEEEVDRHITLQEGINWLLGLGYRDVRALGNHLITAIDHDGYSMTTDIREHSVSSIGVIPAPALDQVPYVPTLELTSLQQLLMAQQIEYFKERFWWADMRGDYDTCEFCACYIVALEAIFGVMV